MLMVTMTFSCDTVLIFIIISIFTTRSIEAQRCPEDWTRLATSCYRVFKYDDHQHWVQGSYSGYSQETLAKTPQDRTWHGASTQCEHHSGYLVSIRDYHEYHDITDLRRWAGIDDNSYVWIGLTDEAHEGHFIWQDGTPVTFTQWLAPVEPTSQNPTDPIAQFEDYVVASVSSNWSDVLADWSAVIKNKQQPLGFICETDIILPPGPPGLPGTSGSQGGAGVQGLEGDKGPTGSTGEIGSTGLPGLDGRPGDKGPDGETGEAGPPGLAGAKGATGDIGLPGVRGPVGSSGPQGLPGRSGATGKTGEKGTVGYPGLPGLDGRPGEDGLMGPVGDKGETGEPGLPGVDGRTGDSGPVGEQGSQGDPGVKGTDGDPGKPGPRGPGGFQGPRGLVGSKGLKGDDGSTGVMGPPGRAGPSGSPGKKGDPGDAGPEGPSGMKGYPGETGPEGPVGPVGPVGSKGAKGDMGAKGELGQQGFSGKRGPPGAYGPKGPTGDKGSRGDKGYLGDKGPSGDAGASGPTGGIGPAGPPGPPGPHQPWQTQNPYSDPVSGKASVPNSEDHGGMQLPYFINATAFCSARGVGVFAHPLHCWQFVVCGRPYGGHREKTCYAGRRFDAKTRKCILDPTCIFGAPPMNGSYTGLAHAQTGDTHMFSPSLAVQRLRKDLTVQTAVAVTLMIGFAILGVTVCKMYMGLRRQGKPIYPDTKSQESGSEAYSTFQMK